MEFKPKAPQDKNAPDWARWKCRDNDGTWHWFENLPRFSKKLGAWVRLRGEWLEVARHDSLPFAELMQILAPYSVSELKPVEQEFEELLHGFYLANQAEAVC